MISFLAILPSPNANTVKQRRGNTERLPTSPELLANPTPSRAKFFSISQPMAPQPTWKRRHCRIHMDIILKIIQYKIGLLCTTQSLPWRPWACAVLDTLIHQCKLVIHHTDRPLGKTPQQKQTEVALLFQWHQGKTKQRRNREGDEMNT